MRWTRKWCEDLGKGFGWGASLCKGLEKYLWGSKNRKAVSWHKLKGQRNSFREGGRVCALKGFFFEALGGALGSFIGVGKMGSPAHRAVNKLCYSFFPQNFICSKLFTERCRNTSSGSYFSSPPWVLDGWVLFVLSQSKESHASLSREEGRAIWHMTSMRLYGVEFLRIFFC